MLAKKLRIKEGTTIVALNAPAGYKKVLGELPKSVTIKTQLAAKNDFVHLFVKNKAELEKQMFKVAEKLTPGGILWISYPKGTSGIQTDLTRDKGWECLKKLNMRWLSLVSFDDNWSAFCVSNEAPKDKSKVAKEYRQNQEQYVDAKTKTVIVPDDLKALLGKNAKATGIYNALSFSCRKEYVLWIVSAKHEQTRKDRLQKTVSKLLEGKKNPTEK